MTLTNEQGQKILNLMKHTKGRFEKMNFPNGEQFQAAYHTLHLFDKDILGQRNCKVRVDIMKEYVDFKDKNVMDLGCNTGGILFQLGEIVKNGIGLDYDDRHVNCANCMNGYYKFDFQFYTFNFDKTNLNIIDNFINEPIDIVFVLSMGSWVKKINELYRYVAKISPIMIVEMNSEKEEGPQLEVIRKLYKEVKFIGFSLDDPSNHGRKLYICSK